MALDPAGVGPSGVAVRLTSTLGQATRVTLRAPDFTYQGHVFNTQFHDDLAAFLCTHVGDDQRVLLVTEDSAYRSHSVARHIGRAIGCMEHALTYLNVAEIDDTAYVTPKVWRKHAFGAVMPKGREALKAAAVAQVERYYAMTVADDLAEAILLSDMVALSKPGKALWS